MQLPAPASSEARELARALGLSVTVADALSRRGYADDERTRRFLEPRLSHLSAPDAMLGRAEAAERIARAVRERERVVVFGDYDCDGMTATAVLVELLRALGGEPVAMLANRYEGGYGLSDAALDRVLRAGPSLLVTCDCGSADAPRLARARAAGVDVVVIDHHLVPDEPLPVVAFLNPHRPDCGFSYKGLASCGLALSLGAAVRTALGASFDLRALLDFVAIGTIADVAPLDGDNRALVRAGLEALARTRRPGLVALAETARLDLARGVTARDVAFRIAPRLNAPGRLGSADPALALLVERDPTRARGLAAEIERSQEERRAVEAGIVESALATIAREGFESAPALVLASQGWSPGVVGIVAGRLASRFGKPAVVVGLDGDRGRGSARAPRGFRLHDALSRARGTLVGFGGHQAAAGVEVMAADVDAFRASFCDAVREQLDGGFTADDESAFDVRLDQADDFAKVAVDLARVEPCGEKNPAVRVALAGADVLSARKVKGDHLKLELSYGGRRLGAFWPQMGARAADLARRVDVLGKLRRDAYRGGDAVEIEVDHAADAAVS